MVGLSGRPIMHTAQSGHALCIYVFYSPVLALFTIDELNTYIIMIYKPHYITEIFLFL